MSIENKNNGCDWCRSKGFTCEKPSVLGEPKARVIVTERGSQVLALGSIAACKDRVIEDIKAQITRAVDKKHLVEV